MSSIHLAKQVYRLHLKFIKKINDVHIFSQQAISLLQEARNTYESSSHKEDRRYYVPSIKKSKFANRTDKELKVVYERFIASEFYENLIVTAISQFESMLFEVLGLVIRSYPQKLAINVQGIQVEKNVPIEVLLQSDNLENALAEVIRRRINTVSYASPKAYLEYLYSIAGITTSDPAFLDYIEIKATRDIIVHNARVINDVYIQKAGERSRGNLNTRIAIDSDYFDHCVATLKRVSGIIERDIKKNFPQNENSN